MSPLLRTKAAIAHLNALRPTDGYASEEYLSSAGTNLVRLKRRNAPLTDDGFFELVHDSSTGCVVGIRKIDGGVGIGSVLVERNGSVCRNQRKVRVSMSDASDRTAAPPRGERMDRGAPATTPGARAGVPNADAGRRNQDGTVLTDEQNKQLLQGALYTVVVLIVLKIASSLVLLLYVAALPLLILYAMSTCPRDETFDAKRELKRVMRGAHLPEEQQPKGFLERGLARVSASIGTELATSLGYEVTIRDFMGACKLITVRVPVAGMDFYWIGAFNSWRYVTQREIPDGSKSD